PGERARARRGGGGRRGGCERDPSAGLARLGREPVELLEQPVAVDRVAAVLRSALDRRHVEFGGSCEQVMANAIGHYAPLSGGPPIAEKLQVQRGEAVVSEHLGELS